MVLAGGGRGGGGAAQLRAMGGGFAGRGCCACCCCCCACSGGGGGAREYVRGRWTGVPPCRPTPCQWGSSLGCSPRPSCPPSRWCGGAGECQARAREREASGIGGSPVDSPRAPSRQLGPSLHLITQRTRSFHSIISEGGSPDSGHAHRLIAAALLAPATPPHPGSGWQRLGGGCGRVRAARHTGFGRRWGAKASTRARRRAPSALPTTAAAEAAAATASS